MAGFETKYVFPHFILGSLINFSLLNRFKEAQWYFKCNDLLHQTYRSWCIDSPLMAGVPLGVGLMSPTSAFYKMPAGRCRDLLSLQQPKTSLQCKFPCFLNMPPTNLEHSASFFGLFLPSACKAEESRGTPEIANPSTWPWAQHRTVRKWSLKGGMEGRSRGREDRGSKVTGHWDLALRPVRLHHLGANLPPLLDFKLKNKDHNLESSLYFSSQNA